MGKITRKRHTAEFEARGVAPEAIKGEQTLTEIGAKHGVHLTMVASWKKAAIEGMANNFSPKGSVAELAVSAAEVFKLHAKIGQIDYRAGFLLAKASGR